MKMLRLLLVPSLATACGLAALTGCFGDTEGPPPTTGAGSTSTADNVIEVCHVDAGCAPPPKIVSTKVTLDGRVCAPEPIGTGMGVGLDGHGWTASFASNDCGFYLDVSGSDDLAYPQTALVGVNGGSSVQLSTGEDPERNDSGAGGTYESNPGGTVLILTGPSEGAASTVKGTARVYSGEHAHDLTFEMVF